MRWCASRPHPPRRQALGWSTLPALPRPGWRAAFRAAEDEANAALARLALPAEARVVVVHAAAPPGCPVFVGNSPPIRDSGQPGSDSKTLEFLPTAVPAHRRQPLHSRWNRRGPRPHPCPPGRSGRPARYRRPGRPARSPQGGGHQRMAAHPFTSATPSVPATACAQSSLAPFLYQSA